MLLGVSSCITGPSKYHRAAIEVKYKHQDGQEVHENVSKDDKYIASEKRKTEEHEENEYH